MKDEVTGRVIAVVAKHQRIDPGSVSPQSTFAELSIDSLDGLQLVFELEEEFAIDIPDDAAKEFKSIDEVVQALHALLAKGAGT